MLTVQKYSKERHLPLLKEWAKSWEYDYPWDFLPSHGWIAYSEDCVLDRNTPLACIMMRECENQTALIDLLLTPKDMLTRGLYRDGVGVAMVEAEHWGKVNGYKFIMAMTLIPQIADFAKTAGFKAWSTIALWRISNG